MKYLIAACAAFVCMPVLPAAAQDYPTRPIRVITATAAGGISDIYMRVAGEEIRKAWGQPLILDNRPGGGMNIGARLCADAPNDGYTICMLPSEPLAYNEFLYKAISYNPAKDFVPIANPFFNTQILVVNASLGVKSLADLAAVSKAKPNTLSYVTPSVPLYVFLENWKKTSGADLVWVPFRGGAEALNGLLSGTTPVGFFGLANMNAYIDSGKIIPLAVDGNVRTPVQPNVPTLRELGYRGPLTRVYFGIVAPAGTPQPIVDKLSKEFNRINKLPEFRQKHLLEIGLEPVEDTPAGFAAFLTADRAEAARIVKESALPLR